MVHIHSFWKMHQCITYLPFIEVVSKQHYALCRRYFQYSGLFCQNSSKWRTTTTNGSGLYITINCFIWAGSFRLSSVFTGHENNFSTVVVCGCPEVIFAQNIQDCTTIIFLVSFKIFKSGYVRRTPGKRINYCSHLSTTHSNIFDACWW